jgi:hypothetical protein
VGESQFGDKEILPATRVVITIHTGSAASRDRAAPNRTKESDPEVKAVADKDHARGISSRRQAVLGKRNTGASVALLYDPVSS